MRLAATLLQLYVRTPDLAIWTRKLWCADLDTEGHRVWVTRTALGMEIHRYFPVDASFGVPLWQHQHP